MQISGPDLDQLRENLHLNELGPKSLHFNINRPGLSNLNLTFLKMRNIIRRVYSTVHVIQIVLKQISVCKQLPRSGNKALVALGSPWQYLSHHSCPCSPPPPPLVKQSAALEVLGPLPVTSYGWSSVPPVHCLAYPNIREKCARSYHVTSHFLALRTVRGGCAPCVAALSCSMSLFMAVLCSTA